MAIIMQMTSNAFYGGSLRIFIRHSPKVTLEGLTDNKSALVSAAKATSHYLWANDGLVY